VTPVAVMDRRPIDQLQVPFMGEDRAAERAPRSTAGELVMRERVPLLVDPREKCVQRRSSPLRAADRSWVTSPGPDTGIADSGWLRSTLFSRQEATGRVSPYGALEQGTPHWYMRRMAPDPDILRFLKCVKASRRR
jgi:hypothetical protein